jgi:hypothetical protein
VKSSILNSLEGFSFNLKQTSKSTTIVVRSESRQTDIRQILTNLTNEGESHFFYSVSPLSSTGHIQIASDPIRIVVKPVKVPVTAEAESAQCVHLAIAQSLDQPTTPEQFFELAGTVQSNFDVDCSLEQMKALDPSWFHSSASIANHFISGGKLKHHDYVFHRNSDLVQNIYSSFGRINRTLPPEQKFSQSDKWQPADIWLIRKNTKLDWLQAVTLESFNDGIRQSLIDQSCIPVSLKKVGNYRPNIVSIGVESTEPSQYEEVRYVGESISSGKTNWLSSKNTVIRFSENGCPGTITFRNPSPGRMVGAEAQISSKKYQLGKLSREHILAILSKYTNKQTQLIRFKPQWKDSCRSLNASMLVYAYALATTLIEVECSYQEFVRFVQLKANDPEAPDSDWLSSKIQAMEIISLFRSIPFDDRSTTTNELFKAIRSIHPNAAPRLEIK